MKIRFGFVSNSSSSSFTCDVCGNTESGMDASARDFSMTECINGHTFCDNHQEGLESPSPEQIREIISEQIKGYRWRDDDWKKNALEELADTPDDELEDLLRDEYSDDGCPECDCPLCSLKHVSDEDALKYLYKKFGLDYNQLVAEVQAQFKTYKEFDKFVSPPEKE